MEKESSAKSTSPKKDVKITEKTDQQAVMPKKRAPRRKPSKKPDISEKARIISKPPDKNTIMKEAIRKAAAEKAAAKKTAGKKPATENTADEKTTAKKTTAKKATAKKATAKKAAAEKAAAKKAAAEKAAAEKAAAEKAAAEKAAAEKAAAKKAAAKKAAAEKAAAEKAAAEKAAAEKAAAEKAAAEKKIAPEPSFSTTCDLPPEPKGSDPVDMGMKMAIGVLVFLFILIIGASMTNTGKYYAKPTGTGLEIWQGKFSPLGEKLLATLPGLEPPDQLKSVYSKDELFTLAFNYYIDKADYLLEVPGMPDFDRIKTYLDKAFSYAGSSALRQSAMARINTIDHSILLYKANVAQNRGTLSDMENALEYLEEAAGLDLDPAQLGAANQQIEALKEKLSEIEIEQAIAEKSAPETPVPAEE